MTAPGIASASAPAVLLPYQQAWAADQAPVKVCEKSRRVGLSWAEAGDCALSAGSVAEAGGMDAWYVGYNQDMAKEFIRDVADWARQYNLVAGEVQEEYLKDEDKDILTFVVRFASGFRVTALSSRPSNLRGKQGIVIIDEAAFHEQLEELLKAAFALLIWGGRVRIISTHNGTDNPFNELILDIRAGKKPYSLHRIEFREAVAQGLYRRICLVRGTAWTPGAEEAWVRELYEFYGEAASEELDVIPRAGGGAWLTRALIESAMEEGVPVFRLAKPDEFTLLPAHIREAEIRDWCEEFLAPALAALNPGQDHFLGEDFARSGDLTDLCPLAQAQNLGLRTPFVAELRNIPFEQQRQVLFYIGDRLPRFRAAALDARGNGQYLAEVAMQRYGAGRVAQVMLSTEWYRENMPPLKAALEDKTLSGLPKDADLLADLRAVRMEKGVAKVPDNARVRGADGRDRHGDFAVALAMAHFAARTMEPAPIEHTPLNQPRFTTSLRDY
jgi:phage FluMu gp28-like protein